MRIGVHFAAGIFMSAFILQKIIFTKPAQINTQKVIEPILNVGPLLNNTDTAKIEIHPNVKKDIGLTLILKNDCVSCHKDFYKYTLQMKGPSYSEIATKYDGDKTALRVLSEKIKLGGTGVWGAVPMLPHATLSDEDIGLMVKYILTVKNNKGYVSSDVQGVKEE
jgi:cytochrome c